MKPYEYKILRYCHDRISGEFINVGVLLYSLQDHLLLFKTIDKYKRLNEFFPTTDGRKVKKLINQLELYANKLNQRISNQLDLDNIQNIESIANQILPKDDSALYFSDTLRGLSINFSNTLDELYDDIVAKHDKYTDKKSLSDDEVWRNIYKKYFDDKKITEKLVPHSIKTKNDLFEFDHCWKNGIWHIYEPISFELTDYHKIKIKIYQYNGLVNELITSKEKILINYLTAKPKLSEHPELIYLMKEKLMSTEDNIKTNIVFEEDAEDFALQLTLEIDSH